MIHYISYLWLCYKLPQLYQLKTANSHYLMISLGRLSRYDGWVSQVKVSEEAVVWLSVSAEVSSKDISITETLMLAAITTTTKSVAEESPLPNWLVKLMSGFSSFWVITLRVSNQIFSECWLQASPPSSWCSIEWQKWYSTTFAPFCLLEASHKVRFLLEVRFQKGLAIRRPGLFQSFMRLCTTLVMIKNCLITHAALGETG